MLNYDVYQDNFLDFLGDRFNKQFKPTIAAAYYQEFSKYGDQTFIELCRLAFNEEFLPAPKWFQEQSVMIAARSLGDLIPRLPSSEELELNALTEEQRIANIKRLNAMMKSCVKTLKPKIED